MIHIQVNRIKVNSKENTIIFGLKKKRFKSLGSAIRFGGYSTFNRTENISIGSNVFFGPECYFEAVSDINIGSGCMFGPRVFCIAGSHNYDSIDLRSVPYDNRQINMPVEIESNVWIGGNVSIAPGTYIGEGSVIAMGAVVAGTIPSYSVVVGEKGRVIKCRDKDIYQKLKEQNNIYGIKFAGKPFELIERD